MEQVGRAHACDLAVAHDQALPAPPRQVHHHVALHVAACQDGVGALVLVLHKKRISCEDVEGADGHARHLLVLGRDVRHQRLGRLVHRHALAQRVGDGVGGAGLDPRARRARRLRKRLQSLVLHGRVDVLLRDHVTALACRHARGALHEAHAVCAGEARHGARRLVPVDGRVHALVARVHLQDLGAARRVGQRHVDDAVKAAGPDERAVNRARAVGGAQHHDAAVVLKAVHLHQQLVDDGGALVAARLRAARRAQRVKLVNKQDGRRAVAQLLKRLSDPARPHARVHVVKVGAAAREHAHARLRRDRLGQQRLARARCARQQHAADARHALLPQQPRVLQVVNDLTNLTLDLIYAVDLVPGDELGARGVDAHLARGRPEVELGRDVHELAPVADELLALERVGHGVQQPRVQQPEHGGHEHEGEGVAHELRGESAPQPRLLVHLGGGVHLHAVRHQVVKQQGVGRDHHLGHARAARRARLELHHHRARLGAVVARALHVPLARQRPQLRVRQLREGRLHAPRGAQARRVAQRGQPLLHHLCCEGVVHNVLAPQRLHILIALVREQRLGQLLLKPLVVLPLGRAVLKVLLDGALNHELLDAQVKVLVVVLVHDGLQRVRQLALGHARLHAARVVHRGAHDLVVLQRYALGRQRVRSFPLAPAQHRCFPACRS
mmetsp:Transcript_9690/g.24075  ORF Transcript_9690/g.24075 Transcript_9690/m.24075 type:complete len:671 (+) Transcript_9690:1280-3292(+)